MSGGKVTIGGTNYKIIGGRTLIDGTGYSIPRGKTLVGGTGYKIQLFPLDLLHLLTHADFCYSIGREASTTGTVSFDTSAFIWGAGTYYLFVTNGGFLGIHKLVYNGSKITSHTQLTANTGNALTMVNIYVDSTGTNVYYARGASPTAGSAVYGAGLLLFRFPGYTVAEVDSILSAVTTTRVAQRYQSTKAAITTPTSNLTGKLVYAYSGEYLGLTYVTAYNNYKVLACGINSNNSFLYMTSSTAGISTTGTSNTTVYQGGIGTIE